MSILFSIFIHFLAYFIAVQSVPWVFNIFSDVKNSPTNCCRAAVFLFSVVRFYYTRRLTDTIVLYVASLLILIPS